MDNTGLACIITKPVTKETWPDFEAFFESVGKLRYCWCMAWRLTSRERGDDSSEARKARMKALIFGGTPVGLLAYADGAPVAWCSVAPRESHHGLGGEESLQNVWSLTCFYVARGHLHQGMVGLLIEQAKVYARENGAAWLEAYPVLPDSPSYRHMGYVSAFEKAGFSFVKMQGTRRHVMLYPLGKA